MNIAIVDPIFKASRLQYSHRVALKAQECQMDIHILTRTNSHTELYDELFQDIRHTLYEVAAVPDDFWFGKIPNHEIDTLIQQLKKLHNELGLDAIYFAGGHEIFPECVDIMTKESYKLLYKIPTVMIDYEPGFLIEHQEKRPHRLKDIFNFKKKKNTSSKMLTYEKLFAKYKHIHIGILDERFDTHTSNKRFFYLPDPSPTVEPSLYQTKNRSTQNIIILIVGLQSDRKGFEEVMKLIEYYESELTHISFMFVGRLSKETEVFRDQIIKSKLIQWEEGFFSEDIIRTYYANCDYVILPYSTLFGGSSGVMSYATAFHKPFITTKHGCVGYRNIYYNMGYTYTYGDIEGLKNIIIHLDQPHSEKYLQMSDASKNFALSHSESVHSKIIFQKLKITKKEGVCI